jgi:PadR family transcriptional regulator, regulatory protein PadR
MKRNRPLSQHANDIIIALALDPAKWLHGYDLMKTIGIKSGTLYPILMRLEERGLLESQWQAPKQIGKPPRHAYRLTDAGLKAAHQTDTPSPLRCAFKEQIA